MTKKTTYGKLFGSLAVAILIGAQYLSTILGVYISGSESGYFTLIMAVVLILSVISFLYSPTRFISGKYVLLLSLIMISFMLTTFLAGNKSNLLVVDFVGMCWIPLLCGGMIKVNYKKVIKYCMCMLILAIPVFSSLFVKSNMGSSYDAIKMSISYAILPIISSGILHFFFYRKESTLLEKILYIVTAVFCIAFITMSYRGSLVAFGLIVLAGIMLSRDVKWSSSKKIMGIFTILIIIVILCIMSSNKFLLEIYTFLNSHNIKIAFVDKNIFLLNSSDLSHGRLEIWQAAIKGFADSPLWGNGMTTFQYYTGYIFPHNIILQFLFDGGLILTIPLVWYIVEGILKTFRMIRKIDIEKFVLILLLSCISLTRVMVSAEVWRVMLLWLLLGILSADSSSMKEFGNETVKH